MKFPFDIKYRPQIESGEYKVVTRDGKAVRIICWDKKIKDGCVMLGLVPEGDAEDLHIYLLNGKCVGPNSCDLFIITPEPELTEFEATLLSYLSDDTSGELDKETMHKCVKARAAELLKLAKKEFCKDCQEKQCNDYRYEGPTPHTWFPSCFHGGPCTNPMHDCINCPRQSTIGINTTTGTSAAKLEG